MKQDKKQPDFRRGNKTYVDETTFVYPEYINLSLAQQNRINPFGHVAEQNLGNVEDAKKFVEENEK